ncbi:hypothetical protein RB601_001582 [Gaeumannomyces tritici]
MPPAQRSRKRKSEMMTADDTPGTPETADERIPTKSGSPVRTPTRGSPIKRRKIGISLAQKQALIDNLQLEVTERARKLRAQYNLQAQGLRTRIEIRVNRIPMALRRAKMGDLVNKYSGNASQKFNATSHRPPPVPEKDVRHKTTTSYTSTSAAPVSRGPGRPPKRTSDEIAGGNKENMDINSPKKRMRASPAPDVMHNPSQVLSPTSSNTRIAPRKRGVVTTASTAPASPAKPQISRPPSPVKKASGGTLISNMVEKARSTRAAAATRKATTSSTASSASAAAQRTRRGATATTAAAAARATAPSRTARRVSGISESSDGSTSTVVRKRVGAAAAPARPATAAATKRTVMGTIKKGVAGATTRKAPAKTAAAPASAATTTSTGRVLRKRG